MPRPIRPWFRFYVEAITDRKLRRLTPTQRWLWVAILGAARESPEMGALMIAEGVPMTRAELADFADIRQKDVATALSAMSQMGMVTVENDVIRVPNFSSRQYESDNVTARTRAHRERSNNVPTEDVGTFQPRSGERSGNGRRNTPETETETETEKNPSDSSARKRATRIEPTWTPSQTAIGWQREQGIPDDLARRELPRFVDYWTAKSGNAATKLDWDATWRNWLRTASDRAPLRAVRNEDDEAGWAR